MFSQVTTNTHYNECVALKTQIHGQETINAHGGDLYDNANYEFVFRDKKYTFKNNGSNYVYTVESTKDDINYNRSNFW